MKSLEKDRRRRYETANDFAADVMRYVTDNPVEACPPTSWYRLVKYSRRNRTALATALIVSLALVFGTAVSVWQAVRATRAEQRAEARYENARRAVDEMYIQVAEKWLSQQPRLTRVQLEFLEKALAFYKQFAAERGDDPQARFDSARALVRVGRIQTKLGRHDPAKHAFVQAVEQLEALSTRFPDRAEYQREFAACLVDLGGVYLDRLDRAGDAEPHFRRSLAIAESLVARNPGDRDARYRLAVSLRGLGSYCEIAGRRDEAERAGRSCRQVLEGLIADDPRERKFHVLLAGCENCLGLVYLNTDRLPEAEQVLRHCANQAEAMLAESPTDPEFRRLQLLAMINLANVHSRAGRLIEAAAIDQRNESLLDALAKDFPEVLLEYRHLRLSCLINQMTSFYMLDNLAEFEQVGRRALKVVENLSSEDLAEPLVRDRASKTLWMIAVCHSFTNEGPLFDPCLALTLARKAIELDLRSPSWSGSLQSLGYAQYRNGDSKGCIESLAKDPSLAKNGCFIAAMAHWRLNKKAEARELYDRADLWLKGYEEHWDFTSSPKPSDYRKVRAEAAALLGLKTPPVDAKSKQAEESKAPPG